MTAPNPHATQAPEEARRLLETVYRLFNARDIDGVFQHMHANVDWPNGMEGGRVHGYDEIRAYWTRQWSFVDPLVEPTAFTRAEDGRILVDVHQVIKDIAGHELINQHIEHLYTLEDGRIRRMDIGRVFPSKLQG
ncbi:MAG TPA: nuclear transport factor 2 family protein [Acidobacteriaceae bacterium]|nr:nuclear transport factor 2 family protein [Acidobacteriaceae bacterium]